MAAKLGKVSKKARRSTPKKKKETPPKKEKVVSRSINVHAPVLQRFLRLRALAQEKTGDYEMTRNGFVSYLLDVFEKKGGK